MQFFINFIHSIIILKGLRVANIHMLNLSDLCELHWKVCQSSNQITLEGNILNLQVHFRICASDAFPGLSTESNLIQRP